MIGPSTGSNNSEHEEVSNGRGNVKRRMLDELDIESFCDEICGHHHNHQLTQQPIKKRFVTELGTVEEIEFSPEFINHDGQNSQITKLEVLVVDDDWTTAQVVDDDIAYANILKAATSTFTCDFPADPSFVNLETLEIQSNNNQQEFTSNSSSLNCPIAESNFWSEPRNINNNSSQYQTISPRAIHQDNTRRLPNCNNTTSTGNNNFPKNSFCNNNNSQLTVANNDDQENGNLSWLLNFKLDPFIEAPDERATIFSPKNANRQGNRGKCNNGQKSSNNQIMQKSYSTESSTSKHNDNGQSTYCNNIVENKNPAKKPPFTYTELIEHALQERGELTVSAIYQWISEHFPYYKSNDDRWKNSVRHNLSINPHFRKGSKAPHGAGHLWAIANQEEMRPRQLLSLESLKQAAREEAASQNASESNRAASNELAAATASILPISADDNIVSSISLEHCAEQILSGIKKEVEVQYLVPMIVQNNDNIIIDQHSQLTSAHHLNIQKDTDFLNPVSKEVVAEECGLIGEGYLVTELNPNSLGLNMVESEIVADHLFGEELNFQFYELTSPSQLQSA